MRKTTILGANEQYMLQTASYGRKDVLLALVLYVVICFQLIFLGEIFIHKGSSLTGIYTFCATGIVSLVCIGLVSIFCAIRKQKMETVGFSVSYSLSNDNKANEFA